MRRRVILRGQLRSRAIAATAVILASAACNGDSNAPDAGPAQATLEVLDPPGDSIGLAFSSDAQLRVRYIGGNGEPAANIGVEFELVAGPNEDVGGSTLSASVAGTASDGIASVVVSSGTSDANYRVRASAPGASPAVFFVVVSSSGFAAIDVGAIHTGPRPESDYQNLEFRLFDPNNLRCSELDIEALPDSVFPPRSSPSFADRVTYRNLASARPYTLLAWGENQVGALPLGFGCVELEATQVMSGQILQISAPLRDRVLSWSEPLVLESTVAFSDLVQQVDTAVAPDPWRRIECDLGVAELLIDCVLDSAVSDGTTDCVVTADDPLIDDVSALRGPPASGCRPDESSPGVASLDRELLDLMVVGPWQEAAAITLGGFQRQLLSGMTFTSSLSPSVGSLATHSLATMRLVAGGLSHLENLASSSRAIVASDTAVVENIDGELLLGSHGFTLDIERALAAAFDDVLLPASNLAGRGDDLGAALADSFGGCAAVSSAVCSRVARPDNCLEVACDAASATLDARLRGWLTAAAATDSDFQLEGRASIVDNDFDLEADSIGGGSASAGGEWDVILEIAPGSVSGAGAFGGE